MPPLDEPSLEPPDMLPELLELLDFLLCDLLPDFLCDDLLLPDVLFVPVDEDDCEDCWPDDAALSWANAETEKTVPATSMETIASLRIIVLTPRFIASERIAQTGK